MFLFLFLCIRVSDYIYVDDADCDYLTLDIQSRWKNVHCYEKQSTFLIGSIRKLPYFLYFAFSIHVFPIFMKINNILDAVFTFTPYHYRWHSFSLVTKKKKLPTNYKCSNTTSTSSRTTDICAGGGQVWDKQKFSMHSKKGREKSKKSKWKSSQ